MKIATLEISPACTTVDQQITVLAKYLAPESPFTIVAYCKLDAGNDPGYRAYAFYKSNDEGIVSCDSMPSQGGTYSGIEPMGLIWSMESLKNIDYARNGHLFRLRLATDTYDIQFSIYLGHILPKSDPIGDVPHIDSIPLAQCTIKRMGTPPNVTRVEVREGRLRGLLFVPTGNRGPYQGMLDINGVIPRVVNGQRAALFASHGYVAFAPATAEYEDLPSRYKMNLEYFIEAVHWLASHPLVKKTGLILTGISMGATIVLHLALVSPLVKAVVSINACSYFFDYHMYYQGQPLPTCYDSTSIEIRHETNIEVHRPMFPVVPEMVLPVNKASDKVSMLFIVGEDDGIVDPGHTKAMVSLLEKAGKRNFKFISYPNVGHTIQPPYTPFIPNGPIPDGFPWQRRFGGEKIAQMQAQEHSWQEILDFCGKQTNQANL